MSYSQRFAAAALLALLGAGLAACGGGHKKTSKPQAAFDPEYCLEKNLPVVYRIGFAVRKTGNLKSTLISYQLNNTLAGACDDAQGSHLYETREEPAPGAVVELVDQGNAGSALQLGTDGSGIFSFDIEEPAHAQFLVDAMPTLQNVKLRIATAPQGLQVACPKKTDVQWHGGWNFTERKVDHPCSVVGPTAEAMARLYDVEMSPGEPAISVLGQTVLADIEERFAAGVSVFTELSSFIDRFAGSPLVPKARKLLAEMIEKTKVSGEGTFAALLKKCAGVQKDIAENEKKFYALAKAGKTNQSTIIAEEVLPVLYGDFKECEHGLKDVAAGYASVDAAKAAEMKARQAAECNYTSFYDVKKQADMKTIKAQFPAAVKKCETQAGVVKAVAKKIRNMMSAGLKSMGDALKLRDAIEKQGNPALDLCDALLKGIDDTIAEVEKSDKMEAAGMRDERDAACAGFEAACADLDGVVKDASGLVW